MTKPAMTLKEVRDRIIEAEIVIEAQLQAVEEETGVLVEDVRIERSPRQIGKRAGEIINIELEAKL